jgi:hypothetical protein
MIFPCYSDLHLFHSYFADANRRSLPLVALWIVLQRKTTGRSWHLHRKLKAEVFSADDNHCTAAVGVGAVGLGCPNDSQIFDSFVPGSLWYPEVSSGIYFQRNTSCPLALNREKLYATVERRCSIAVPDFLRV